jgi:hypothetical protein
VRWAAPALSAAGLGVVFVLVLVNFDVLIGAEGPSPLAVVIPGIVLAAGVAGLAWGEHLRRHRPEVFAGVGSGRAVGGGGPAPDPRPGPSSGGVGEPELAAEQR